jgi:hypothetical protein
MANGHSVYSPHDYLSLIDAAGELPLAARRSLDQNCRYRLESVHSVAVYTMRLGLICAERSWIVWESKFPGDSYPMDVASRTADIVIGGRGLTGEERREVGSLKTLLDNKLLLGEDLFPAVYAGFSAWAVARDAASFSSPGGRVEVPTYEPEDSPEDWEPCFHASLAITGGAVWEGIGDPQIRREFWVWYLTSAVPWALAEAAG